MTKRKRFIYGGRQVPGICSKSRIFHTHRSGEFLGITLFGRYFVLRTR